MEPLQVLEQRSGMAKGEAFAGPPGLRDVTVRLASHERPNCSQRFSSLSDACNTVALFLKVWLAGGRIPRQAAQENRTVLGPART